MIVVSSRAARRRARQRRLVRKSLLVAGAGRARHLRGSPATCWPGASPAGSAGSRRPPSARRGRLRDAGRRPRPRRGRPARRAFDSMRERARGPRPRAAEFIANASHELRTPLFSLGGFVELSATRTSTERRAATSSPRCGPDRPPDAARHGSARPLAARRRAARGRDRALRPRRDRPRSSATSSAPVAEAGRPRAARRDRRAGEALGDEQRVQQIGAHLVENAIRHTPRARTSRSSSALPSEAARARGARRRAGIPAEDQSTSSSASTAPRGARRRAAGSASRSPRSLRAAGRLR